MIRYAILGQIAVSDGERTLPVGGPRIVALLGFLIVHANQAVSTDELLDALWHGERTRSSMNRLRVAISRLRKVLEVADQPGKPALSTVAGGYQLDIRSGELDADLFESRLEEGRRALDNGDPLGAASVLRDALASWRGPALAEVRFEDWAQPEIRRLEELRLVALENRVEADLANGRHGDLTGELQALVARHPERERLAAQLMLALYRCDRQTDALEVYQRVRHHLSDDLGLEPGPALRALQRAVLDQSPSLALDAPRTPPAVVAGMPEATRADAPATALKPFPLPPFLEAGAMDRIVGRDVDLEQLEDARADTARGPCRLLLLSGEPGIGKTRLAAELALRAHRAGATVLHGRCDEDSLLPQQPFVEAIRHYVSACPDDELAARLGRVSGELRRVVPELGERIPGLAEPLAGDPEGARSRLFDAVGSLLVDAASAGSLVLVLDDLHWADSGTLLLLRYLVRYPRVAPLLVIGTYRDTQLSVDHPLAATIAELTREHLLRFHELTPLDPAAVSDLVGVHLADGAPPDLPRMIFEGTEGNAFFVVEVLRHLAETRTASGATGEAETGPTGLVLPREVMDVIRQRVAGLGPQTNRLLVLAAVLGHAFAHDVLGAVSGLDEDDLVDALDSSVGARVIEELAGAPGRFTFSHALIRDTLYDGLTETRRALLHRRAGLALEELRADDPGPHLAQLAHHFAQAAGDPTKAIEYGTRAGERASGQLAYEQAAAHFRQTVALVGPEAPRALLAQRCDVLIAQGEAERQAGDPAYRLTLLEGARAAQALDDPDRLARAALANNRGFSSSAEGVDRDRVTILRAALDAYDVADSPTRAALLALLSLELVGDDDWRARDTLGDDALAMARRVGHPRTLALVLTQLCVAQWRPQNLTKLQTCLEEAASLADRLNDPLLIGHAAYLGAHAAMEAGDLEAADRLVSRLGAVAEQLAQPLMRWYLAVARAKRQTISGPPHAAEQLSYATLELGTAAGQSDVLLWFLGQLFVARYLHGTLDSGDPHLPSLLDAPGSAATTSSEITPSTSMVLIAGAAVSVVLCEVGRLDDARMHFDVLMRSDLEQLRQDYTSLAIPAHASVACARLGDTDSAARLYAILEPHSDRIINTGSSWFGVTTHYVGLLAATLDRIDEAHERFAAAEAVYATLDAQPWLARLRGDWAAALLKGGRDKDVRLARRLGEQVAAYRGSL